MRTTCILVALLTPGAATAAAPPAVARDAYGDQLPEGAVARYGNSRLLVRGMVSDLRFSPDGKRLVCVSSAGAIVWDVATGKKVAEANRERHGADLAVFGPRGRVWLYGPDCGLTRWDVDSGQFRSLPEGDSLSGHLCDCAVSADGKRILFGTDTGRMTVYSDDLQELHSFSFDSERPVWLVTLSSDGKTAIALCHDTQLQLWDVAGKKLAWSTRLEKGPNGRLILSPDGKTVAVPFSDTLRVCDTKTGKPLPGFTGPEGGFLAIAFSGKGLVAVNTRWGIVQVDATTGKVTSEVTPTVTPAGGIEIVALSPDGRIAALACAGSRKVILVDTRTGKPLHADLAARRPLSKVWWLANGRVACAEEARVMTWSPVTGKLLGRSPTIGTVFDVSPSGDVALTSGESFQAVSLSTGKALWKIEGDRADLPYSARFAPDGKRVLTAGYGATLRVAKSGRVLRSLGRDNCFAAWSPDGRTIQIRDRNGFGVIEAASGDSRFRLRGGDYLDTAMSPDGRRVALLSAEGELEVWQLRQARRLFSRPFQRSPHGDRADPPSVRCSPDGRLVAVTHWQQVGLWDMKGQELAVLHGHVDSIRDLCFSPDGRFLVTASLDGTALVWDVAASLKRKAIREQETPLDRAWDDLSSADAKKALAAMCALEGKPADACRLAGQHLRPARAVDARRLARLVADLGAEEQDARSSAFDALARLDLRAEAALLRAADAKSAEVRRAVRKLLARLDGAVDDPERLREVRAVEVLEHVGTRQARALLEALAKGAEARLTREAKEALARMNAGR